MIAISFAPFLRFCFFALSIAGAAAFSGKVSTRSPNPVVTTLAQGMSLLKPVFAAEAALQANLLGASVDQEDVQSEINAEIASKDIVIYTYALSPFSGEAIAMLEASGYDYEVKELGAEWFLLGPKESVKRVLLAEYVDNGATSLPKVFVKGNCVGGCAELAAAVQSGSLDEQMSVSVEQRKSPFSFFGN